MKTAANKTAVDLFAGCGGSSSGAKKAGMKVLWAANHNPKAVECHAANHPETDHACQDLRQADWRLVPDHDFLMASPECKAHSKAKGKERQHHDSSRATAWAVIDCVEVKQPSYLVVENVPEFANWRHFQRWQACLEEDYKLASVTLDAADFGIPQHRVRMFILGIHRRLRRSLPTIKSPNLKHTPVRDIIDWQASGWSKVSDKVENTIQRVREARWVYGDKPFLIAYYGSSRGGRSLDRPLGTITTHDRYALVWGKWLRMLTVDEYKLGMGFDKGYILPSQRTVSVHLLGNAVVPVVMESILTQMAA